LPVASARDLESGVVASDQLRIVGDTRRGESLQALHLHRPRVTTAKWLGQEDWRRLLIDD